MMIDSRDVVIRKAEIEDVQDMHRLQDVCGDHNDIWDAETLERLLFNSGDLFTYDSNVALFKGDLIGFTVTLSVTSMGWVKSLMVIIVDEDYRRNGVGSMLLDACKPEKSGDKVNVEVGIEDYKHAKFFKKNGYIVTSVCDEEFDDEGNLECEGFFIMSKEVKKPMSLETRNLWRARA